ncbi:MAG: alpha/beta hydrolase [Candidatus Limnocylindrales bacterium]
MRAGLTSTALVVLVPGLLVLAGGFLPDAPAFSRLGALLNDGVGWVWASVLGATLLSTLAVALGGHRGTLVLLSLSLVATAGAGLVTASYITFARDHGSTFDVLRTLAASPAPRRADEYVTYATVDGVDLRAGIWRRTDGQPSPGTNGRAALLFVHGGAFVSGGLDSRPALFASLVARGTAVIDIEYRLTPPPRWNEAPADVLCALGWLRTVAIDEGIDPDRVVIMGESAGGSLALLAAYAAGTGQLAPSCPGDPIIPAGVIAVAPAADLVGIWQDATIVAEDRRFPEAYIGGPPSEHPDRYELASPFRLIRADVPPTLLIAAENDHLVRLARVTAIADALKAAGASYRLLVAPFVDHGFDGPPNGFGARLEEAVVAAFLVDVAG